MGRDGFTKLPDTSSLWRKIGYQMPESWMASGRVTSAAKSSLSKVNPLITGLRSVNNGFVAGAPSNSIRIVLVAASKVCVTTTPTPFVAWSDVPDAT